MTGVTEGSFGSILIVLSARSIAHVCQTSLCYKGRCTPCCISCFVLKLLSRTIRCPADYCFKGTGFSTLLICLVFLKVFYSWLVGWRTS